MRSSQVVRPRVSSAKVGYRERLILRVGQILTAMDERPILDGYVVVAGSRIVSVGGGRLPSSRHRDRVMDFNESTVLPGLIDCHEHLLGDGRLAQGIAGDIPLAEYAVAMADRAARILREGITTVRVPGAPGRADLALRTHSAAEERERPRMLCAGLKITTPGGHGGIAASPVVGPAQAREAALREIQAGADFIKVIASGGVGATSSQDSWDQPELTSGELASVTAAAHDAGFRVAAHANGVGIANALDVAVDSVEHGIGLTIDQARFMAKKGIALVPTLSAMRRIAEGRTGDPVPQAWARNARGILDLHIGSFGNALREGVRIAVGTDGFGDFVEELKLFISSGLAPYQALQSATRDAAHVLFSRPQVGVIAPGALADLIVVRGDPLESMDVLREVQLVIIDGRVRRAALANPDG